MIEDIYNLYKHTRQILEKADLCCDSDHSDDERYLFFKSAIEHFDAAKRGYAERYEKEKQDLLQVES